MKNREHLSPKAKAFMQQVETGDLKKNKHKVMYHLTGKIQSGGSTISEMRQSLYMAHQTLTATLSMLEDDGQVYKNGVVHVMDPVTKRKISYSIYHAEWDPELQKNHAEKRLLEKFEQWKKQGLDKFQDIMNHDLRSALKQTSLF